VANGTGLRNRGFGPAIRKRAETSWRATFGILPRKKRRRSRQLREEEKGLTSHPVDWGRHEAPTLILSEEGGGESARQSTGFLGPLFSMRKRKKKTSRMPPPEEEEPLGSKEVSRNDLSEKEDYEGGGGGVFWNVSSDGERLRVSLSKKVLAASQNSTVQKRGGKRKVDREGLESALLVGKGRGCSPIRVISNSKVLQEIRLSDVRTGRRKKGTLGRGGKLVLIADLARQLGGRTVLRARVGRRLKAGLRGRK